MAKIWFLAKFASQLGPFEKLQFAHCEKYLSTFHFVSFYSIIFMTNYKCISLYRNFLQFYVKMKENKTVLSLSKDLVAKFMWNHTLVTFTSQNLCEIKACSFLCENNLDFAKNFVKSLFFIQFHKFSVRLFYYLFCFPKFSVKSKQPSPL